eukprot:scaffold253528_cov31-Tisochrysis_lutea.AAC.2
MSRLEHVLRGVQLAQAALIGALRTDASSSGIYLRADWLGPILPWLIDDQAGCSVRAHRNVHLEVGRLLELIEPRVPRELRGCTRRASGFSAIPHRRPLAT